MNGLDYVITFDVKTMVKHAVAVATFCNVRMVTPTDFVGMFAVQQKP